MLGRITSTCLAALILSSCDSGLGLVAMPAMELEGRVLYEARLPTETGASNPPEVRPARFVDVEVINNDSEVIASTSTDADGRFVLDLPAGGVKLIGLARVDDGTREVTATVDSDGARPHRVEAILADADLPLEIVAVDEGGPAGAFHIVDTVIVGLDKAEEWTGQTMPPVFIYWGRGVTTTWSFFYGEQPPGSGRYGFEILGGQPGAQHTTDTDEHDEVILIHELGHMVMTLVSTDSSFGGPHPPGVLTDPGLAWEEGRVSWFAAAVMNDPTYQDTVGVQPEGSLRVDRDYSKVNDGPQGNGSEQTVGEVLWDLADGADDVADEDDDGVALGPQGVIEAMMDLRNNEGSYPCLSSFLWFLVSSGRVEEIALREMLSLTGQPPDILPATADSAPWPLGLALGDSVEGDIDGLTDPAPSGGEACPETGLDATRAYRFRLERSTQIELVLDIDGAGTAASQSDLDLDLRDTRALLVSRGSTEESTERIGPTELDQGWYVVIVRDGGEGNRAHFQLSLHEVP